ncbi:heavy-metal-associated domain-containing protein [Nocardioides pacificus]
MNHPTHTELPLAGSSKDSGGCCGGGTGGCGCSSTSPTHADETASVTAGDRGNEQTMTAEGTARAFGVTGMTCGHCVAAVTEELKQLPGVTHVGVDLVAGGASTVTITGTQSLDEALVATALEEAGDYHLV